MKLPDNEPLGAEDFWTVQDTWKQEWEKGVQVSTHSSFQSSLHEIFYSFHSSFLLSFHPFILPFFSFILSFHSSFLSYFLSFHSSFLWHNYKDVNPRFGTSFIRLSTKQEILFLILKKNTKVKQKSNVIHILVRQIIIMFP